MIVGRQVLGRRRGEVTGLGGGGARLIMEQLFESDVVKRAAIQGVLGGVKNVVNVTLRPQGNATSGERL